MGDLLKIFLGEIWHVVVYDGMEWVSTVILFRCSGIRISMIFPWDNYMLTQPMPIRHPGSVASFRDILVPKLLNVGGNIKKC